MNKPHWNSEEAMTLAQMYKSGASISLISKRLNRTEKSIYNYINRNRDRLKLGRRQRIPLADVKLETAIMPTKRNQSLWERMIDDIIGVIKK